MVICSPDLLFAESLCSELSDAYAVRVISDWPELIGVLASSKCGLALVDQHYPVTEIMALSPATKVLVVAEDVNYPALKDEACGCTRTILRRHRAPR